MSDKIHLGWAVAACAYTGSRIVVRPFTVGTFYQEDAERYAYEQVALEYPPAEGWTIIVSAMPVTKPFAQEPAP